MYICNCCGKLFLTSYDLDKHKTRRKEMLNEKYKNTILFKKCTIHARAPNKTSHGAAGFDLCSAYDYTIPSFGKKEILTDLRIILPKNCYGRIASRSGLAVNHFLHVIGGVIDRDFSGIVTIVLVNFSKESYLVKAGDRVAQLIPEKIYMPYLQEIPFDVDTNSDKKAVRNDSGFGSSGY